ncbi:MAG: hypothetical protein KIT36_02175 [Alphaproteobacteria bacterium]|nr:hypothetical protein [Alphaproteobacteria bacterium]
MAQAMPSQRLYLIAGAVVLVVAIIGAVIFMRGDDSAQTADQSKTETPAATPGTSATSPSPSTTPSASDTKN